MFISIRIRLVLKFSNAAFAIFPILLFSFVGRPAIPHQFINNEINADCALKAINSVWQVASGLQLPNRRGCCWPGMKS